jgi:hypothetical protein
MNSLAEKGVFRFAKMARVEGRTGERGPHGENLLSFQIAAPKFGAVWLCSAKPGASVSRGMTGWELAFRGTTTEILD